MIATIISSTLINVQIVDLDDPALEPEGWKNEAAPENANYQHPADMSVYELHIRDFSISDSDVPEQHRGKYSAFAQNGFGARHLRVCPSADKKDVPLKEDVGQQLVVNKCSVFCNLRHAIPKLASMLYGRSQFQGKCNRTYGLFFHFIS